ncbi:hypothetical protein [Burkholderia pyrrocinia]|uniref:hypothetical protein n=2 Tax=Burkholderia TaxID=32008 RepID=UPI001FC88F90|nr:hypothetical protein [Burkholderia pyrrocinia]
MFYRNIAGDWHRDSTRDHDITEGSNVLNVLSTWTEGFHDLQLRQLGGKWRQTFGWSAGDGEYQPRASNLTQESDMQVFKGGIAMRIGTVLLIFIVFDYRADGATLANSSTTASITACTRAVLYRSACATSHTSK